MLLYSASLTPIYSRALELTAVGFATISFAILSPLDASLAQHGDTLWSTSAGSAVTVHTACTGYEIISVVTVFMLAYPASFRSRVLGICGAALLMSFVNLSRIVSVYWISTHHPTMMTLAHEEVWPIFLNLSAVGALVGWFLWLKKDETISPSLAT